MKNIKYSSILFFITIFSVFNINAQSDFFRQGQVDVNIGVGFLPHYTEDVALTVIPPISVSVDYGVSDYISVGIQGIYASAEEKNYFGVSDPREQFTSIIGGGRVAFHFPSIPNMDTYVGGMAGYHIWLYDEIFDDYGFGYDAPGGFIWSGFVGGRFVFSNSVGVFFEAGYGVSYVTAGLNFAF